VGPIKTSEKKFNEFEKFVLNSSVAIIIFAESQIIGGRDAARASAPARQKIRHKTE